MEGLVNCCPSYRNESWTELVHNSIIIMYIYIYWIIVDLCGMASWSTSPRHVCTSSCMNPQDAQDEQKGSGKNWETMIGNVMLQHDETGVAPRWIRRKTALQWPCGAWSMKNIAWQPNLTVSRCFLQICTVELSPLPLEHQMRRAPMLICRAKSTSPTHLAAITCWPRTSYVL